MICPENTEHVAKNRHKKTKCTLLKLPYCPSELMTLISETFCHVSRRANSLSKHVHDKTNGGEQSMLVSVLHTVPA